jgi:hypothetical protein
MALVGGANMTERDMLEAAEYFLDILDKAKAKPDRHTEIPNGLGVLSASDVAHGEWMGRARKIINHRKSQYMATTPQREGGEL